MTPDETASTTGALANYRVLFIEDEAELRALLPHVFHLEDAVDIDIAVCGMDGWHKYLEAQRIGRPFDIIVCDISMPDLAGTALARRIRESGDAKTLIAFYTAWNKKLNEFAAEDVGAVAFWVKSIMTPTELRENICALLGSCDRRAHERRSQERRHR